MTEAFDVLPGIMLPVREVTSQLASMWEVDQPDSSPTFHASQMNVVLHFGLNTKPEIAREQFDGLVRFAQRYPCRIIVLCPSKVNLGNAMESKLFSQCYIGESHREMCCCEALILRYDPLDSEYLFNQVSIWLESDLPTYYWFSGVPVQQVESYLEALSKLGVYRCIFDSSDESMDLGSLNWASGFGLSDLAEARLLPLRQVIGQFLSRYPDNTICEGLQTIQVRHTAESGEGRPLLKWLKSCLDECGGREKETAESTEFLLKAFESASACSLEVEFTYTDKKYFAFAWLDNDQRCELRANFGESEEVVYVPAKELTLEQVLGEAFFFR